ncbi:MAG: methyltransferase domain-containing protein [bacterium]|nr:methyltransferase domain-containing protein [bacterium]
MKEVLYLHKQYLRQARWTEALRYSLYRKVHLARKRDILELGCGSGVILGEISERTDARLCGIDRDLSTAAFAKRQNGKNKIEISRAEKLPFKDHSFDLIVTHYFWLWQKDPEAVLSEAKRVLKKGGHLVSLCEPDYPGRSDEPSSLIVIRDLIAGALIGQGADPGLAGNLENLMAKAGFRTEAGRQEGCWDWREYKKQFDQEWEFIGNLCGSGKRLEMLKKKDLQAVLERKRRLCLPIQWAIAKK